MYRVQISGVKRGLSGLVKSHKPVVATVVGRHYSEHREDTLHIPEENKGRQLVSDPPVVQGIQPMPREMLPKDTREVLARAQVFIKNQQDRAELLKNKLHSVNQGAACREFHSSADSNSPLRQLQLNRDAPSTAFGTVTFVKNVQTNAPVCGTADTWDEEMACVLQGSCLPGSTKYCPTKSLLGKVTLSDIQQGSGNGQSLSKARGYHTTSSTAHNRQSHSVGRTYEAWDEDSVLLFFHNKKDHVHELNEIPEMDRATRHHYHTDPRSQFVPKKERKAKFGETNRSLHTGDINPVSEILGRHFETWDEDVAHMLHNLPGKPVFGRPRQDIRPASTPPVIVKYVPVSCGMMLSPLVRHCHTSSSSSPGPQPESKVTQRERLKQAVRDYGATVVVFHVGISLLSLGGFYLAVSSGIDMQVLLNKVGMGQAIADSKVATGASTFVVAYAVHKMFAPVRIGITLTSTPFIVRYLRRVGVLKTPHTK